MEEKKEVKEKGLVVGETRDLVKPKDLPVVIDGSPIAILQNAIEKGLSLDSVERMIELQQKYDGIQAEKAYNAAMAEFKKNPPVILKDSAVGYKNKDDSFTGYKHASLGNVTDAIGKALANHGLFAQWKNTQDSKITVTCYIKHKDGHSESTFLSALPDNTGKKNAIQQVASTITYLQRYTILSLTGLATIDQDDDGVKSEPEPEHINEKKQGEIRDLLASKGHKETGLLKWLNVESVDKITEAQYKKAMNMLDQKVAK